MINKHINNMQCIRNAKSKLWVKKYIIISKFVKLKKYSQVVKVVEKDIPVMLIKVIFFKLVVVAWQYIY